MSDETLNTVEADTNTQEKCVSVKRFADSVRKRQKSIIKILILCGALLPNAERFYHAVLPELVRSISVSLRSKSSVRVH